MVDNGDMIHGTIPHGWKEQKRLTAEAFADPRPGDRFHEMLSYWMYVVAVNDTHVEIASGNPPIRFPGQAKRELLTREAFIKRYSCGRGVSDFWVVLHSRGNDVRGWARILPYHPDVLRARKDDDDESQENP